ncbi:MAG TPA: hypothetical protein VJ719_03910 [Chthoniobacterales bacterium]|nr:hypothetical protein [Chthoniobacterales bacterium]
MTNPPADTDYPLLFEWAPPKGEKFLITTFLIGSLFVHLLAFYLFRIIYPPPIAVLPSPARLTFVEPTTEEGRTLLRWIEAEDPALASATVRPPEARLRALPKLSHVPSYIMHEPKLKDAPPMKPVVIAAEPFPPGPAPIARQPEQAWPKIATRAFLSEELTELGQPRLAPAQFSSSSAESPENMQFRIGVNRNGEIRFCFRISSSGDPKLDEQARVWLVGGRFPNAGGNVKTDGDKLTWGVATIEWGNDVAQPKNPSSLAPP